MAKDLTPGSVAGRKSAGVSIDEAVGRGTMIARKMHGRIVSIEVPKV